MKDFEQKIIAELLQKTELRSIPFSSTEDNEVLEFSGAGYFLTIKDLMFPKNLVVLDSPDIRGKLGGIEVGYLAFIENSELMLECYSYDQEIMPMHREQGFERDAT